MRRDEKKCHVLCTIIYTIEKVVRNGGLFFVPTISKPLP